MIWKVSGMIVYLPDYFDLAAGDVILSVTAAGVGPVVEGDIVEFSIEGLGGIAVPVV